MSTEFPYLWRYADTYEFMERVRNGMPPVIICVACNGGVQGKESNEALPESADEIADSVYAAYMAGASIGPCGLMDRIGLDVVRDIELVYYGASQDPTDRPPPLLEAMVARGDLGEKAGRGFYAYPNPAYLQPGWLTGEAAPVAATVA